MYAKVADGGDILVLLGCRGKKVDPPGPAIEVYYPSGAIASVKTALRDGEFNGNVDVYFLSAKYGLITADSEIEDYDQKLSEDEIPEMVGELGEFLNWADYDVLYSFVDGLYKRVVNEVAYKKQTEWDIETAMWQPCGRAKSFDGSKDLSRIVRKDVETNSAAEVDW